MVAGSGSAYACLRCALPAPTGQLTFWQQQESGNRKAKLKLAAPSRSLRGVWLPPSETTLMPLAASLALFAT